MAWYKRYMVPFQSKGGNQYVVYIYEHTSGSIITLTGAANPFETSEIQDDNIFTSIREQTGSLRIIDETAEGNLLETLIPSDNISKMVCLYTGTWNSSMTTFTDDTCVWKGFLCANAYTQSWDDQKKVVEFPIKSILGILQDISLPESDAGSFHSIAYLFDLAFNSIDDIAPDSVVFITEIGFPSSDLLGVYIQWPVFYRQIEVTNQGDSFNTTEGITYYDALSFVLKLFGLMMRENGTTLVVAQYDEANASSLYNFTYTWTSIHQFATQGITPTPVKAYNDPVNLLDSITFKGSDNILSFIQGRKNCQVTLPINDPLPFNINLPQTTEDSSSVLEVPDINNGQVFVQPHAPRSNNIESFVYHEYDHYNKIGSSDYSHCLNNSVIYEPLYDMSKGHAYTGAFPCRWYYKDTPTATATLKNGLFLNQNYRVSSGSMPVDFCYSIKADKSYTLQYGYLRIKMNCYNFDRGLPSVIHDYLVFGTSYFIDNKPLTTLYCVLTFGNYDWNGEEWVQHSGNYPSFGIDFDGTSVKSNKTSAMNIAEDDGWFIPIPNTMSGQIRLYILDGASCYTDVGYTIVHSRIIAELTVDYIPLLDMIVSRRSENVYRETIIQSGFNDSENQALEIGTLNNNLICQRFIMRSDGTYIQNLQFSVGYNTWVAKRPELNLLSRMAAQYEIIRRTMKAVGTALTDIYTKRYIYNSKRFFSVNAKHNWRDDTQEVKFIEVS